MARFPFERLTESQQQALREYELYQLFHQLQTAFNQTDTLVFHWLGKALGVQFIKLHQRRRTYTKEQKIVYAYFKGLRIDRTMPFARAGQPKVTDYFNNIEEHLECLEPFAPQDQRVGGAHIDAFLQNFIIHGMQGGKWV